MVTAAQHLAKAKRYLGKGDASYRKAAEEILAAKETDPRLSYREVDRRLGRSNGYAGALVRWHQGGGLALHPFAKETPWRSPSGGDDEWYTQPDFVKAARKVLGSIDLDPASCTAAQKIVRAKKYYSLTERGENGLELPWAGRIFMNPPFSIANKFGARLREHYERGDVQAAIMVVNGYSAGARWFEWFQDFPWCLASRPAFYKPGEPNRSQPMVWAGFVYLGDDHTEFTEAFNTPRIGRVYKDPTGREWQKRFSRPPSAAAAL